MKLNLTYIDRKERTSARTNKPFTSVTIKAKEYGEKFLSGFGNKENSSWQVGQEVEVASVNEVSKDGKIYLNFEMPKFGGNGDVMKALERIENRLTSNQLALITAMKELASLITEGKPKSDYPTPESEGIAGGPNFGQEDTRELPDEAYEVQ